MYTDSLHTLIKKSILRCPYCLCPLSMNTPLHTERDGFIYGSAYCNCDEYPILRSILYLHKDTAKQIMASLIRGDLKKCLFYAINRDNYHHNILPSPLFQQTIYTLHSQMLSKLLSTAVYKLVWKLIFGRQSEDYTYYFHRQEYSSSLPIYFPLGFRSMKNGGLWMDIGGGISNHYSNFAHFF